MNPKNRESLAEPEGLQPSLLMASASWFPGLCGLWNDAWKSAKGTQCCRTELYMSIYSCSYSNWPSVCQIPLSHRAIYDGKLIKITQEPIQIRKLRFQELLLSLSTQPPDCSFSCLLHMLSVFICNAAGALLIASMYKASIGMGDIPIGLYLAWLLIQLFNEASFF